MRADMAKIRYNAVPGRKDKDNLHIGGGPHTLKCGKCGAFLRQDEEITNTRRRDVRDSDVWVSDNSPRNAWRLIYSHVDCNHPYGRATTVVTNSNGNDGWNRTPTPPAVTTLDSDTANTSTDERELIKRIVNAVAGQILPQLNKVAEEFDSKLDTLNATVTANQHTVTSVLSAAADAMSRLADRVSTLEKQRNTTVTVNFPDGKTVTTDVGRQHKNFQELLNLVKSGSKNIWITGPKGGGKTEAVKAIAKALGFEFVLIGMVSDPTDLLGYCTHTGDYVATNFFRGFTSATPVVMLMDEMDGWDSRAGLAINPALANGMQAFPHGTFEQGENVLIFACANTWGYGATDDYVGRNAIDESTLDRFEFQDWPYDEEFERELCGYGTGNAAVDAYVDACLEARATATRLRAKVGISPRATIKGSARLRGGLDPAATVKARFQRERSHDLWRSVGGAIETFALTTLDTYAIPADVSGIAAD